MCSEPGSELVINSVICYVSTARHVMNNNDIARVCLAFYKDEDIIRAKDLIYEIVGEKPKRRRHENRMMNEMQDLLDVLKRCEDSGIVIPKYVADSYNSLPPSSGFETVAHSLVSLIDEVSSLRKEIKVLKENRRADDIHQQDMIIIKEDLISVKGELRRLNHRLLGQEVRRNNLMLQSLDKSL